MKFKKDENTTRGGDNPSAVAGLARITGRRRSTHRFYMRITLQKECTPW